MKNLKYIVLVIFALSFFGCKKNQLGGKSNIKGKIMHHDTPIPYAKIYIKFKATEFPGESTSAYDATLTADHNGNFLIDKIYRGQYYFYAIGSDPGVSAAADNVKGGVALKVKMMKEITGFEIPVVE